MVIDAVEAGGVGGSGFRYCIRQAPADSARTVCLRLDSRASRPAATAWTFAERKKGDFLQQTPALRHGACLQVLCNSQRVIFSECRWGAATRSGSAPGRAFQWHWAQAAMNDLTAHPCAFLTSNAQSRTLQEGALKVQNLHRLAASMRSMSVWCMHGLCTLEPHATLTRTTCVFERIKGRP